MRTTANSLKPIQQLQELSQAAATRYSALPPNDTYIFINHLCIQLKILQIVKELWGQEQVLK